MNSLYTRSISHHRRCVLLLRLSFSTASSSTATSPSSSYSSHFHRRSEEESRAVKVSVWWDFENCRPPCGVNVYKISHCITSAVRVSGIKGPVQITAFGDVSQLSRVNQEALSATGIALTHVPSGGKNSADRSLLVDLMYWVSQNPPPGHLFLISGDRDFAGILHRLRMSNYNILLACPPDAPRVLCSAASIMWYWNALAKGESFTGKYINQPPDGPYNSWYGHYKGVLEDPYAVVESPANSHTVNTSASEPVSKTKAVPAQQLQPVPRDVIRKLTSIVNSYPKGISISELGALMISEKVIPDREFYGHKSFSRFLLSKPNIVKLKPEANGNFLVFPSSLQASKPVQCSTGSETQDSSVTTKQKVELYSQDTGPLESDSDGENHDLAASSTSKAQAISITETVDQKSQFSSSLNVDKKETKSDVIFNKAGYTQGKEGCKPSSEELLDRKSPGACVIDEHIAPVRNQDSDSEMGYFRKKWSTWFRKNDMGSNGKTDRISNEILALNSVQMHGAPDSHPLSENKVSTDANVDAATVEHGENSNHSPGFFGKLLGWFKLSRKDSDADTSNESVDKSNQIENSQRDALFLMDSFWSDIESFLNTYKGSKIIWSSKTREEIAQNLRKDGPLVIQPLDENDLLDLINQLISEKKWIEERPLSKSPFKVLLSTKGNAESAQSNTSSRLRSIILDSSSQSDELSEQQDKCKLSFDTKTKPCLKTKDEVLADCKKLLEDMFEESPDAVNVSRFKNLFVERYGYLLDHRKLGYTKLTYLLQTMPDLRVGLNFVYPSSKVEDRRTNGGVGKAKDEENDSPWEELGPVDSSVSRRKEANLKNKGAEDMYESPLSEDEISDSEEEESKTRTNKESSLLRILDSWYQDDNNNNNREGRHRTADLGRSEIASTKQRPGKSYSFVADHDDGNKDKLIDGILYTIDKKSGEQRIPN